MNTSQSSNPEQIARFSTVDQFARKYPVFTKCALRSLLFNRSRNGLDRAVVQVGRRILIDEAEFVAWLREQKAAA